jgi:hypothetical protein
MKRKRDKKKQSQGKTTGKKRDPTFQVISLDDGDLGAKYSGAKGFGAKIVNGKKKYTKAQKKEYERWRRERDLELADEYKQAQV